MAPALDPSGTAVMGLISQAFGKDQDLYGRIIQAINEKPSQQQLFDEIATYHLRHSQAATNGVGSEPSDEPSAKKRKLANGSVAVRNAASRSELVLEVREVSFSIPQRKKLHFRMVQYVANDSTTSLGVQAVNPADNTVEYELPSSELDQILRVPVPEKATKQFNFIFIPSPSLSAEPILFTIPAAPPKGGTYTFPPSTSTLEEALTHILQQHNLSLTVPDEKEFASATPESHRKSEKAFHVKAFRGSKDGFLFFLSNGIFFGFKKPLLFLPLHEIESISYTSVLQRTFNLNIAYRKSDAADGEEEEVEFSMLDQGDYSGINDYIQRHGLNDASLAAGRRAKSETKKKANTSTVEGAAAAAADDAEEDDGRTELEKAEQQLQDDEDELEEDFEPSDEDDDGSGSEAESDGADDVPTSRKSAKNLVEDELGSEAEDVEITDDDNDVEEGEDDEEEEEEDLEEEVAKVEPSPASKPVSHLQRPQPIAHGRWGAAINSQPDPDDDDQL